MLQIHPKVFLQPFWYTDSTVDAGPLVELLHSRWGEDRTLILLITVEIQTLTEWSWGSLDCLGFNLSCNERIKIKPTTYNVEVSQSESFHYHAPFCNSQSCVPQTLQLRRGILIVSICNADFYLGFRTPKEIRLSALPMLPPTLSAAYRTTGYTHVERQRSNPDLSSHVGLTEWKLPDK